MPEESTKAVCIARFCDQPVPLGAYMCLRHWQQVPAEVQAELHKADRIFSTRHKAAPWNYARLKAVLAVAYAEKDSQAIVAALGPDFKSAVEMLDAIRESWDK